MFNPKILEWLLRIKHVPIMVGLNDYTQQRTQAQCYKIAYMLDKDSSRLQFHSLLKGKKEIQSKEYLQLYCKQGGERPLDTPKRMIEKREREGEREKERNKERYREGGRDKRERE